MIIFCRYVDDPHTSEQDLHKRSGQAVEVLRPLTADEADVPMFRIRFADGFEADAFADELHEEPNAKPSATGCGHVRGQKVGGCCD